MIATQQEVVRDPHPDPLPAEGEGSLRKRCPSMESSLGRTGGFGGVPRLIFVPQSMGDYQGVWMLFPPFKGDSRGLDNKLTHSSIVSGLARRGIISQYPFVREQS
jgi:hypothetical protein